MYRKYIEYKYADLKQEFYYIAEKYIKEDKDAWDLFCSRWEKNQYRSAFVVVMNKQLDKTLHLTQDEEKICKRFWSVFVN